MYKYIDFNTFKKDIQDFINNYQGIDIVKSYNSSNGLSDIFHGDWNYTKYLEKIIIRENNYSNDFLKDFEKKFNNSNIILRIREEFGYTSKISIIFADNTNNQIINTLLNELLNKESTLIIPLGFLFTDNSIGQKLFINGEKIVNDFLLDDLKNKEELKKLLMYIQKNY